MRRLEPALLGLFAASWTLNLLDMAGVPLLAGSLELSFYGLYILAAVLGWLAGNLYNARRRSVPAPLHRRLFALFAIGPAGLVIQARLLASEPSQAAGPFVWLYAVGVYMVFFLVPVLLRPPERPRPPRIGSR
jgi:uncharacterized membrane protein YoaK (UPF0700 family)